MDLFPDHLAQDAGRAAHAEIRELREGLKIARIEEV